MTSNTASPIFNVFGLRPALRGKVSLIVITLVGVLVTPSVLYSAEQSSSPAVELGNSGKNAPSTSKYQSAAGRYLEPGEVTDLAEERSTATPSLLVGNAAAGPFLVSAAQYGIVSLSQTTGAINFCAGYTYLNSGMPFGKCKKIGTISPTGLLGNARIDATSNTHAFVTNTATGLVVECYLGFNSGSGEPVGSCISQQLQP